jgi:saccharopine dehydrogenase-like NADP-dependent oxidoreductase
VTVLTGLGWTPGLSNLLARKAADQLDNITAIKIAWGSSASDSEGYAIILHTMHIFSGLVPSRLYGWSVDVPAGSGKEAILFPAPVGVVNCYHVGHPEPVTIPRFYPDVDTVTLKGGLSEQPLNDLAILLAWLRLIDTPVKRDVMGKLIQAFLPLLSRLGQPEEPCSAVRVDVTGQSNEDERTLSLGASAQMKELTGLPLAIGALWLARGEIHMPGVVAPEACIEPDPFLDELERRGVRVHDLTGQWPEPEAAPAWWSPLALALISAALGLSLWLWRRKRRDKSRGD